LEIFWSPRFKLLDKFEQQRQTVLPSAMMVKQRVVIPALKTLLEFRVFSLIIRELNANNKTKNERKDSKQKDIVTNGFVLLQSSP